jgi:hypothetical protein
MLMQAILLRFWSFVLCYFTLINQIVQLSSILSVFCSLVFMLGKFIVQLKLTVCLSSTVSVAFHMPVTLYVWNKVWLHPNIIIIYPTKCYPWHFVILFWFSNQHSVKNYKKSVLTCFLEAAAHNTTNHVIPTQRG